MRVQVEVGRRTTRDFQLRVGEASEQVIVTSTNELIEHATISVGHVIDRFDITRRSRNPRLLGPPDSWNSPECGHFI